MVVYGYEGTVPVTMDMSINHCQAVRRGAPNTYIIGDMPFGSYHTSVEDAVANAVRFMKEGGVDAIKLEGGVAVQEQIKAIARAGIVVFGHVGLTPQSSASLGGFKVQGRTTDSARAVIEDAIAVYKAGARTVLLEGVPEEVCGFVHRILPIPVYGIGAGSDNDGQVLVMADALGMFTAFTPKFAKKYADIAGIATQGFVDYIREVKDGSFPAVEHKYKSLTTFRILKNCFLRWKPVSNHNPKPTGSRSRNHVQIRETHCQYASIRRCHPPVVRIDDGPANHFLWRRRSGPGSSASGDHP
jgi:3-methyl-2-oxobutanoate hydroxymethyltransferase